MKNIVSPTDLKSDDLLLTVGIWFANADLSGLTDYALKAMIGGVVWFGFKLATEYFSQRIKNKNNHKNPKEK